MNPQSFAFISIFAGCLVTIFWMVVGWRAMRAHEKIAQAMSEDSDQRALLLRSHAKKDRQNEAIFREFLNSDPIAQHLDANEQLRRFGEWKAAQGKP